MHMKRSQCHFNHISILRYDYASEKPKKIKNEFSYMQNIDAKLNCQNHRSLQLRRDLRDYLVQNTHFTDGVN